MDINPAWMKFDYYQAGSHPSDPTPVPLLPTQQPDPVLVLHPVHPRLHRGLRAVTIDKTVAPDRDTGPQAALAVAAAAPVSPARWLRAAIMTTRPRQWPKNLLVFAAPLAGASLGRNGGLGYALVAMIAFGCASAAVYFVNDVADAERDRRHPVKRNRPDRLRRAARAARARARRARRAVRGRRGRGDPRAAARRHGLGLPVPVVPLLVPAQARAVRRDADRGVRVPAAGARRRGGDARAGRPPGS